MNPPSPPPKKTKKRKEKEGLHVPKNNCIKKFDQKSLKSQKTHILS
jgi:hypothetical protein